LRWLKFETRRIPPTVQHLRLFLGLLRDLHRVDREAGSAEEFREMSEEVIARWNREFIPMGVKLQLKRVSPFDASRRPFGLRMIHLHGRPEVVAYKRPPKGNLAILARRALELRRLKMMYRRTRDLRYVREYQELRDKVGAEIRRLFARVFKRKK